MRLFSNNASTTLTSPLGDDPDTDLVLEVDDTGGEVAKFPLVGGSDYAYITVEDVDGQFEIMQLVAISGTEFTVVRGQTLLDDGDTDGTPSYAFIVGSRVELRTTAGAFESFVQRGGDSLHGGVFGDTPAVPENFSTLRIRHSTDVTPSAVAPSSLLLGELAYNAKSRKLYAGGVTALDAAEVQLVVPGWHVGTSAPTYPSAGMIWFDTTTDFNVLKVYDGSAWVRCFGMNRIVSALLMANAVVLQGHNAAGDEYYNLAKVNGSDEIEIGDADAALLRLLADIIEVNPVLRLKGNGGSGNWVFTAAGSSGASLLTIEPTANGSGYTLTVRSDAGVSRTFAFDENGFLTLPSLTPTADYHAVPKVYLQDQLTAATGGRVLASGRVSDAGATVGTVIGFTSSGSGGSGGYTITLSTALSNVNNANVQVSVVSNSTTAEQMDSAEWYPTSTTTIVVRIRRAGANPIFTTGAFSITVVDTDPA